MECSPKNTFGIFGSLYFAGLVVGSIIFPRMSDIYGRKWISVVGNILHIAACIVILFSHSLELSMAMNFLVGVAVGSRAFVGYVWMSEYMRIKDVAKVTSLVFLFDSMCIFNASILFKFITKDWRALFGVPIAIHIVAMIWLLF